MLYDRKIKYLDYYESGAKVNGGGFAKLEVRDNTLRIELTVRGLHPTDSFERDIMLQGAEKEETLGQIRIQNGCGQFRYSCDADQEIGATGISYNQLRGIRISIGGTREILCRWDNVSDKRRITLQEEPPKKSKQDLQESKRESIAESHTSNKVDLKVSVNTENEQNHEQTPVKTKKAEEKSRRKEAEKEECESIEDKDREEKNREDSDSKRQGEENRESSNRQKPEEANREGNDREKSEEANREGSDRERPEEANREGSNREKREEVNVEGSNREKQGEANREGSDRERQEGKDREGSDRERQEGKNREDSDREKQEGNKEGKEVEKEEIEKKEYKVGDNGGLETKGEDMKPDTQTGPAEMQVQEATMSSEIISSQLPEESFQTATHPEERSGEQVKDKPAMTENNRVEQPTMKKALVKLMEDKWQQLSVIYPHIQPFRDERDYLSLTPSDFVLFPDRFYRAVNNSFLLHGYYNYHHLILARVERRGEILYYIGVPGNYFEREKQVAIMFGFESFECETEPAKTGDFGYYMMRTEL